MTLSQADHSTSPPRVEIPRQYNAAHDLLARNAQRAAKPAFIDASTGAQLTYGELTEQAHRFANALRARPRRPRRACWSPCWTRPSGPWCSWAACWPAWCRWRPTRC
jgi:non-ribosomal peptide synthetase component F